VTFDRARRQTVHGAVRAVRRLPGVQRLYEAKKNYGRKAIVVQFLSGGVGAELGVQKGYFSQYLLRHGQPDRLHLVDPWYLLGPSWEWAGGDRSTTRALARIIRRQGAELSAGRVVLHIQDDLDFLAELEDEVLDWAYVDTSHEYEHTVAELELLQWKVKRCGTIAGDDWREDPSHPHHGVCRAIRQFCLQTDFEVVWVDTRSRQWAIRRTPLAR